MLDTNADVERVHRQLQRIVKARGALDLQEAAALREAQRLGIWRPFGYSSLVEYMEMRLGYSPQAARDRLRVANIVETLPRIAAAMDSEELPFGKARELVRVVTPETEPVWLEAIKDKNTRQVEAMVAEHHPGDLPTDPPDPGLRRKVLRYEVKPETYALIRQVQQILEKETGGRLDDDALIRALCRRVLDGDGATRTKPPYQIAVTVCATCMTGQQESGGLTVEMSPAAVETALCDATNIGALDADKPSRVTKHIPDAIRRQVHQRDHYRCSVPWCRSTKNLDIHHTKHRRDGGTHEPRKLCTLCESHHLGHHEGSLEITGDWPNFVFTPRAWLTTHVGFDAGRSAERGG
jgi:hypothetical protein